VFVNALLGDVFRAVNPWRAGGRAAGWLLRRAGRAPAHRPYPAGLGRWPAAAGLLAFTWMELASGWAEEPRALAAAVIAYSIATWVAMAVYGVEAWARDGEAFGTYFNLFARVSPFETRDGVVGVRPPLSGPPGPRAAPGNGRARHRDDRHGHVRRVQPGLDLARHVRLGERLADVGRTRPGPGRRPHEHGRAAGLRGP
jgi:hypothetical protein